MENVRVTLDTLGRRAIPVRKITLKLTTKAESSYAPPAINLARMDVLGLA